MRIGVYMREPGKISNARLQTLFRSLESEGCELVSVSTRGDITGDMAYVMSVGGDGTFLSCAMIVGDCGVPVIGVNLGRLGFLSENSPEIVAEAILSDTLSLENRSLLKVSVSTDCCRGIEAWPYALNEMTVHRAGAAMLGVDVALDGVWLPTYWADGLLVATSSGSTAYSLSVGGPIVVPESKVLIVAPIASHNLNVRPLVVPDSTSIRIRLKSRDSMVRMTLDNRTAEITRDTAIELKLADFSLRRAKINGSSFINALTDKLYWGEDIRNSKEYNE